MNLIRVFVLFSVLNSQNVLASEGVVDSGGREEGLATWYRATHSLKIIGEPARGLYLSLNAVEVIDPSYARDPFALRDHQRYIVSNEFATCIAIKEREIVGGDGVFMRLKSAVCYLIAPAGTTN